MARQTLASQMAELERELDEKNRYIDFAIRFETHDEDGPTGVYSETYGGKFDVWSRCYISDADKVVTLGVSENQQECLASEQREQMGKGGRGGGKSHLMARWTLKNVCRFPGGSVQLTSPSYKKAQILWRKVLAETPKGWLLPGKQGVRLSARELRFMNGCVVRFFSAQNVDGLRGEDNDAAGIDERQDVTQEAVDNIMLTLRRREDYEMLQIGTPKMGTDFHLEYLKYIEREDADVFSFPSFGNPFIPQGDKSVFAAAAASMDRRRYQQEVLAEFVALDGRVYHAFTRFEHVKEKNRRLENITPSLTYNLLRQSSEYVIGIDYALDPLCAVVCIVTEDKSLWAIDEVVLRDEADITKMATTLIAKGYGGSWICDLCSSDKWGGKSSPIILKKRGFMVSHPKRMPHTMDIVNAVCAKMKSHEEEIGMYIDPKCRTLIQALESRVLIDGRPDKARGYERITDALGNVVHRLFPMRNNEGSVKMIVAS